MNTSVNQEIDDIITQELIKEILEKNLWRKITQDELNSPIYSLQMDSLSIVDSILALEKKFNITIEDSQVNAIVSANIQKLSVWIKEEVLRQLPNITNA